MTGFRSIELREECFILGRLKRWLRPLRPVLAPIWHWSRSFIEIAPVGQSAHPWTHAIARAIHPIRPIRRSEFSVVAARYPYYRNRWGYMSVACGIASELIRRHRLRSALELGPHLRPVIV